MQARSGYIGLKVPVWNSGESDGKEYRHGMETDFIQGCVWIIADAIGGIWGQEDTEITCRIIAAGWV